MESGTNVSWKTRTQEERFAAGNLQKTKKTFSLIKTLLIISKGKGKQIVAQIIQSRLGWIWKLGLFKSQRTTRR